VNSGSVGVPLDGDKRAGYVRLWWEKGGWRASVLRLPYDRGATRQAFWESGYLHGSGVFSWLFYYEWAMAQSLIPTWFKIYRRAVAAGEVDVETAVRQYLYKLDLPVPM
jgi:hypothetical protein